MEINKKARNFRQYSVWQIAVEFATEVYHTTSNMPYFERKGLCDQLQRAVVSISSNIAEGSARPSDSDFAKFLDISLGSSYEVETQLIIAKNIGYINNQEFENLHRTNIEIQRQIVGLIRTIRTP